MKKLALVLFLVLMLTFVGCSSKTTVKETDAFRFDSKTGYAYSTAPFGIDTTELESAIGSKLTMVSESPATAPFAYTNYSSEDIVQSADCSGKFDAQFDENGKLFSVTFHEQLARGTAEEHFEAASKRFSKVIRKDHQAIAGAHNPQLRQRRRHMRGCNQSRLARASPCSPGLF